MDDVMVPYDRLENVIIALMDVDYTIEKACKD